MNDTRCRALRRELASALLLLGLVLPWSHGCRPAPPPVRLTVLGGAIDPLRFLAAVAARAASRGADALESLGASLVSEGDQLGSFIVAARDSCVLALAQTGSSVRDVDLFVFDDGGDMLAADESPHAHAAVLVCPPHPRRLYVAARVIGGTGILALGVMPVPPAHAAAVARELQVPGRPGEDTGKLGAWPGLEAKLRERRSHLGSSWEDVRRAALSLDPHAATAVTVTLDAGRCLDVFATASEEVSSIELELADARGRVVARGKASSVDQGVVVCGDETQDVTVLLRPQKSYGRVAVVVARTPIGGAVEVAEGSAVNRLNPTDPLPRAIEAHRARTATLALDPSKLAGEGRASSGVDSAGAVVIALQPGCSRIDVVGGTPLGGFTAELWSEQSMLLGRASGGATAALFACTRAAAKARVEVSSAETAGPFAVLVRRGDAPEALLARPLAAARLLGRLEAAQAPIDFSRLGNVQSIDVADGERSEQSVSLATGCHEWIAAAEDGRGLAAELIDGSGKSRASARGDRLLSLATCSDTELRAKLRLQAARAAKLLLLPRKTN